MLRVKPSHFSSQSFPLFQVSLSHLLIFRVRPYNFFESVLLTFPSTSFLDLILPNFFFWKGFGGRVFGQSFLILGSALPTLFSQSVLPVFWGDQTCPYFWVRLSILWVSSSHFSNQTFLFYLLNFYLISLSSFYSSWVWLEDVWFEVSTESVFLMIDWFRGDINKLLLCTVYLHLNFGIFKCVSWTPN